MPSFYLGNVVQGLSHSQIGFGARKPFFVVERAGKFLQNYGKNFQAWTRSEDMAFEFDRFAEAEEICSQLNIRAKIRLTNRLAEKIVDQPAYRDPNAPEQFAKCAKPRDIEKENLDFWLRGTPESMQGFMIFAPMTDGENDPGEVPEKF